MVYEVLGIEDLVKAKKTQRDKDWPMIRRLVDAHYDEFRDKPTDERIRFWLRESRTPEVLMEVAGTHPKLWNEMLVVRPLLSKTLPANGAELNRELERELAAEKQLDEDYWRPLMRELEGMRRERPRRDT